MTKNLQVHNRQIKEADDAVQEIEQDEKEEVINNLIVENVAQAQQIEEQDEQKKQNTTWEPILSLKKRQKKLIQEKRRQYREEKFGLLQSELSDEDKAEYEDIILTIQAFNKEIAEKEISKGVIQRQYNSFIETSLTLYDGLTYKQLNKEQRAQLEKYEQIMSLIQELDLNAVVSPIFEITEEVRVRKNNSENIIDEAQQDIQNLAEEFFEDEVKEEVCIEENKETGNKVADNQEKNINEKPFDLSKMQEKKDDKIILPRGAEIFETSNEEKSSENKEDLVFDETNEADLEKYLELSEKQ